MLLLDLQRPGATALVEPFTSGQPNEVKGRDAIRKYLETSIEMRPADMTASLDNVEVGSGPRC